MQPKPREAHFRMRFGRGAFHAGRSIAAKRYGLHGSENDGMSSEKQERNLLAESPRVPGEGSSAQG